jgi:hypothetical protein
MRAGTAAKLTEAHALRWKSDTMCSSRVLASTLSSWRTASARAASKSERSWVTVARSRSFSR